MPRRRRNKKITLAKKTGNSTEANGDVSGTCTEPSTSNAVTYDGVSNTKPGTSAEKSSTEMNTIISANAAGTNSFETSSTTEASRNNDARTNKKTSGEIPGLHKVGGASAKKRSTETSGFTKNANGDFLAEVEIPYFCRPCWTWSTNTSSSLLSPVTYERESLQKLHKNMPLQDRMQVLLQVSHHVFQLQFKSIPSLKDLSISDINIKKWEFKKASSNSAIQSLKDIYCRLLFNMKLPDKDVFDDLVEEMGKDNCTIENVLKHPFHWTSKKKIIFICEALNFIDGEKSKLKETTTYLNEKKNNVVGEDGWCVDLMLDTGEIENIRKDYNADICPDVIYNKSQKKSIDKDNIVDLMRFFRNRHVHYWEENKDVRLAFGSYNSGYWEFYARRFPKFFMHIYHKLKNRMRNEGVLSEDITPCNSIFRTSMK